MNIDRIQGTDGIRGPVCLAENCSAAEPLTALLNESVLNEEFFELYTYAYCQELLETGFAEKHDYAVIGWDPRDFSGRFNQAAVLGIRKAGLTAVIVDVLPTPAISLYQLHIGAACAFALTASHNPSDQNGIKIFLGRSNLKLLPEDDKRLTRRCLKLNYEDLRTAPLKGEVRNDHEAARKYFLEFTTNAENHWLEENSFAGTTIVVDAANGAFSNLIKDLLGGFNIDFIYTNCTPVHGINIRSGVADLEGVDFISADEINNGLFRGYETLQHILEKGREQKDNLLHSSNLVLGIVFDGDGDRCFLLSYDPYNDRILVHGGDVQSFFQAKLLQRNFQWNQSPLFVNTVESDLEAGRAVQQTGFDTMQCAVGDKWILWQAFYYDLKAKRQFYLQNIDHPEFKIILGQATSKLEKMAKNSKFDALAATQIVISLEKWIQETIDADLVKSASEHACRHSNNYFAIGSEESGHVVTLAKMNSGDNNQPVFIGNSMKCALNSLAAIQALRPPENSPEFFEWLKNPYPSGFQKSLPVYYVDKSLLNQGSELRNELEKLLFNNLNWPGMEVEKVKRPEEPEMLLMRVSEKGFPAALVFVRNSGTEDKLALYLRGTMELAARLEALAEKVYSFLLCSFKNNESLMAKAEQAVLQKLEDGPKQTDDLNLEQSAIIPLERLLHEMNSRQKLIQKNGDVWSITHLGLTLINHSECSE